MSQTIAHRHGTHVHIPLAPMIALAVAAIIAAAVLILINQPTATTTQTETAVGPATTPLTAEVPKDLSPAFRLQVLKQAHAPVLSPLQAWTMHNRPEGTLEARGAGVLAPPAPAKGLSVQHRWRFFSGKAR
jgi:hypothetical protein